MALSSFAIDSAKPKAKPIKARINRNLGAAIKVAVGAVPQTANGH